MIAVGIALSDQQLLHLRLRSQGLERPITSGSTTLARLVGSIVGLQAQEVAAARLAVRARSTSLTATDVDQARVEQRSLVRTWAMRGTLHLLAAEDISWLLALLGPVFIARGRRRRLELGLDQETSRRGLELLRATLARSGPLTRAEIVEALSRQGINLVGQAAPHLLGLAALSRIVCCGPDRGRETTYVLLDDWIEPSAGPSPENAVAELTRRYLRAYGPAGPEDFAAWSGLPRGDARVAWTRLDPELFEVTHREQSLWLLAERWDWLERPAAPGPIVRLLGGYDSYLLGYRDRALSLAPEVARRLHPGGGVIRPSLLVDGRVAGVWRVERRTRELRVIVEPFARLSDAVRDALADELADLARFLGTPLGWRVETSG